MSGSSKTTNHESNSLWVLTDASPHGAAETLLPPTPVAIDAEKLGEQLEEFVRVFAKSLDNVKDITVSGYNLTTISVDVKISATLGVVLIGAGVAGGITLTFSRK